MGVLPFAFGHGQLVSPPLVKVGEPGNPGDDGEAFKGSVAIEFQMGKYEVTIAEYAVFLNAVAKADTAGRYYSTAMALSARGGIQRSGAPGSFIYTVKRGYERRPVNFVALDNAKRFCNWLHNGAVAGVSTENGAYDMAGAKTRIVGARYFVPNADEWHKAAYYEPSPANRPSVSYWTYATRSDAALPERINFENHYGGPTDVLFPDYPSFFGTFGQNGNVQEILEDGSAVGGTWESLLDGLIFSRFDGVPPLNVGASATTGFRVAAASGILSGSLPPLPDTPVSGNPLVQPLLSKIGLPFNPGDDSGSDTDFGELDETSNRGAVPYEFQIGTYEVTNREYAIFLNAVARADAYRLYNTSMGQPLISEDNRVLQGGILRTGQSGSFAYTVRTGFENKPVNFLDPYSAMRFCNWLHNGAQPASDTEYGAYAIGGRIWQGEKGGQGDGPDIYPVRSASARYYIPTLHEWHKAAYYDPAPQAKPTESYWRFATRSDLPDVWPENYKGRYGGLIDVDLLRRTSHFGTIGQGGNVSELTITKRKQVAGEVFVAYLGGHWETEDVAELSSRVDLLGAGGSATGNAGVMKHRGLRIAAPMSTLSGAPPPKGTAGQQISFKLPASKRMGPAFKIAAKSSSGRPVRFESSDPSVAMVSSGTRFNYVLLRSPGTVVITAIQDGDATWAPTETARTLEVLPRTGRAVR
jgi:formylglycine-generating enzyme required for sulfatase activity